MVQWLSTYWKIEVLSLSITLFYHIYTFSDLLFILRQKVIYLNFRRHRIFIKGFVFQLFCFIWIVLVFDMKMFGLVSLLLKGWKFTGFWFRGFDFRIPKKGLWQRNRKWTFRLEGFNILTVAVTTSAIAVADITMVCQDPRNEPHLQNKDILMLTCSTIVY